MGNVEGKFDLTTTHRDSEWLRVERDLQKGEFHFLGEKKLSWLEKPPLLFQSRSEKNRQLYHSIKQRAVEILGQVKDPDIISVMLTNLHHLQHLIPTDQESNHHRVNEIFDVEIKKTVIQFVEASKSELEIEYAKLLSKCDEVYPFQEEAMLSLLATLDSTVKTLDKNIHLSEKEPLDEVADSLSKFKEMRVTLEGKRNELFKKFISRNPGKAMVQLKNGEYSLVIAMRALQSSALLREMFSNFSETEDLENSLQDLTHLPPLGKYPERLLKSEPFPKDPHPRNGTEDLELHQWINGWEVDSLEMITKFRKHWYGEYEGELLYDLTKAGYFRVFKTNMGVNVIRSLSFKLITLLNQITKEPEHINEILNELFILSEIAFRFPGNGLNNLIGGEFDAFLDQNFVRKLLDFTFERKSTLIIDFIYSHQPIINFNSRSRKGNPAEFLRKEVELHPNAEVLRPMIEEVLNSPKRYPEKNSFITKPLETHPFDRKLAEKCIQKAAMGKDKVELWDRTYYLNLNDSLKVKMKDPSLLEKIEVYKAEIFVLFAEYLTLGEVSAPISKEDALSLSLLAKELDETALEQIAQQHLS